jgi:hypothetical protein
MPSSNDTSLTQLNNFFILSLLTANLVLIVGLLSSYLIYNFLPEIPSIFFTKLEIDIDLPHPTLNNSNLDV